MNVLFRIAALILAALTPLVSFFALDPTAARDQNVKEVTEKAGGFITGICHPGEDYDAIKGANIGWVREDMLLPLDANGNVNWFYPYWKESMKPYLDNGIKLYVIFPNPKDFLAWGIDFRTPEGEALIRKTARFLIEDLQGFASAIQVANEQGVDRFTLPFTVEESAAFIGAVFEEMYPLRGDILIGYNLGGPGLIKLPPLMKPYADVYDFVGVDLYLGCFDPLTKNIDQFIAALRAVRRWTKKPVILAEFGYISGGAPKSKSEKQAILQGYGFASEKGARADINTFIGNLPPRLREEIERHYGDMPDKEKGDLIFNGEYANHIYQELNEGYYLYGYPHTEEGQAKFYRDLIPKLKKLRFLCGAFIYMWSDEDHCYVCGQENCPIETRWGLVDRSGHPKAAYYAVKDAFAS